MQSDNQRIARNTIFLYGRMIVNMLIGMWTSRLILNALGFTDQGIYNVVGGFVGFLGLITASVGGAISRSITFEIGRNNIDGIKTAISNAIAIQLILAAIVLLFAETLGLWYINNKLVVDGERMVAVNIIYQFSVASFVLSLISSTASALIVSYERMGVFASISVVSTIIRLIIAIIITYTSFDRLIFYAFLQFGVFLGLRIFYQIYVKRNFPFFSYKPKLNKEVFRPMFSFAGWNMIGSSAVILKNSGTSLILNYFGGPIVNTINGIANQVNSIATIFVSDFTTAFQPQITKKYASKSHDLVPFLWRCSKFSYCLLMVMAVPIYFNIEPLLIFWLKKIPDGTTLFAQLIIIFTAIDCICKPLVTAKNATGNIRNYQIVVGGVSLLTIPLSYLFLKIGLPIWFSYIAIIITSTGAFIARILMLRGSIPGWSSRKYIAGPVFQCIYTTLLALILPVTMHLLFPQNFMSVVIQCFVGFIWSCFIVYFVALNREEKDAAKRLVKKLLNKIFPNKWQTV